MFVNDLIKFKNFKSKQISQALKTRAGRPVFKLEPVYEAGLILKPGYSNRFIETSSEIYWKKL